MMVSSVTLTSAPFPELSDGKAGTVTPVPPTARAELRPRLAGRTFTAETKSITNDSEEDQLRLRLRLGQML
jgi:hypothetical protein